MFRRCERRARGSLLSVLIGVGASAAHYLQEPNNPGFLKFPTITALRVVLGSFYLAFAPFQSVRSTRALTSSRSSNATASSVRIHH